MSILSVEGQKIRLDLMCSCFKLIFAPGSTLILVSYFICMSIRKRMVFVLNVFQVLSLTLLLVEDFGHNSVLDKSVQLNAQLLQTIRLLTTPF